MQRPCSQKGPSGPWGPGLAGSPQSQCSFLRQKPPPSSKGAEGSISGLLPALPSPRPGTRPRSAVLPHRPHAPRGGRLWPPRRTAGWASAPPSAGLQPCPPLPPSRGRYLLAPPFSPGCLLSLEIQRETQGQAERTDPQTSPELGWPLQTPSWRRARTTAWGAWHGGCWDPQQERIPWRGRVEGDPKRASPLRSFVPGGAAVAGGGEGDWCLDEGGAQGTLRSHLAPSEGNSHSCHTQREKAKDAPWGPHSALASGDGAGGGRGIRRLLLGTPTPGLQQTGSHCLHTAPRGRSPRPPRATLQATLGHAGPCRARLLRFCLGEPPCRTLAAPRPWLLPDLTTLTSEVRSSWAFNSISSSTLKVNTPRLQRGREKHWPLAATGHCESGQTPAKPKVRTTWMQRWKPAHSGSFQPWPAGR